MAALVSHTTTFTRHTCKITRPAGARRRRRQVSPAVHRCAVQSASGGQRRAFVRACMPGVRACMRACVLRSIRVPFDRETSPPGVLQVRLSRERRERRACGFPFFSREDFSREKVSLGGKGKSARRRVYIYVVAWSLCVNNDSAEAQSHRLRVHTENSEGK